MYSKQIIDNKGMWNKKANVKQMDRQMSKYSQRSQPQLYIISIIDKIETQSFMSLEEIHYQYSLEQGC